MWHVSLLTGPMATFWAMQAVYPVMKAGGGGRIINFASLNGEVGERLTDRLQRLEGGDPRDHQDRRARVGSRRDPRQRRSPRARRVPRLPGLGRAPARDWPSSRTSFKPIPRMGDPEEDIGGVALFLASDDSRYVTGHTIFVDGGAWLGPSRRARQDDPATWKRPEKFARAPWGE